VAAVPAAALPGELVEPVGLAEPAEGAAVAAWSGCRPEASASAWAGRDSIRSSLPAESDATTKRRGRSE